MIKLYSVNVESKLIKYRVNFNTAKIKTNKI